MALPLMIYSSSNNHRNSSLSLVPSFINGGELVMNNGFTIATNTHTNRNLSLVPSFGEPVMNNGVFSNYSNQQKLSFAVSSSNHRNRSLSLVPSFSGDEPVINGVSSNYSNQQKLGFAVPSNNHRNRSLSLVPTFNGGELVINGVSSNYSNQQNLGFAVSSSNYRNRSLSLVPSFNGGEPVINGVSYNYSDEQKLGFSVSSNNCRNRSLSLVPSFNIGAEPVNMTGRRRSFMRNDHSSYSSLPVAASEIPRARLISALSTRHSMFTNLGVHHPLSTQIHSQNLISSQQRRARLTVTELDDKVPGNYNEALAPSPLNVCYPPQTNNEQNMAMSDDDEYDIESSDGVTHSLPCKKYGPYTCPRCLGKFPTSQMFAAHVGSHYKYETKAQRRRRLMARIRRRNLRLHRSREGLTLVPTKRVAQRKEGPMNMAEAEANGDGLLSTVQIKEEPADF